MANDSGGETSPHVRIRIDPSLKDKWLEYADEQDITLTDLIKDSVYNTINDNWVLASEAEPDIDLSELDLGGSSENFEGIQSQLDAIQSGLSPGQGWWSTLISVSCGCGWPGRVRDVDV